MVLTYPYVINPDNVAMLWQAVDGMRFDVLGDYAITPGPHGDGSLETPVLQPDLVENLFAYSDFGTSMPGLSPKPTPPPPLDPTTVATMQDFLSRYHVETVVIDTSYKGSDVVGRYMEAALGGPPISEGGVLVWFDVGERVRP